MLYKFAIGFTIALLLASNRVSQIPGLNLLNYLYIGFPSGVEGVVLLLFRLGTGVLFLLHGYPKLTHLQQ